MESEASRVVRVANVPLDKPLQDLHDLTGGMAVDHILYNARAGCVCNLFPGLNFFSIVAQEVRIVN
jgi:hypothetical protein